MRYDVWTSSKIGKDFPHLRTATPQIEIFRAGMAALCRSYGACRPIRKPIAIKIVLLRSRTTIETYLNPALTRMLPRRRAAFRLASQKLVPTGINYCGMGRTGLLY
jgi:hypothetical protein